MSAEENQTETGVLAIDGESAAFLAQIFTQRAKESQQATNTVFDNYDRKIENWKESFLNFFEAVEDLGLDSQKLNYVLRKYAHTADRAAMEGVWV